MRISAVIFDLDGTLLNTIYDIGDSLNHILRKYKMKERTYDEYIAFVCNGSKKLVERVSECTDDVLVEKILEEYIDYYSKNYSVKTVPYEGISELLQALAEKGVKLGVCSNKPDNIVKDLVHKFFPNVFLSVRGQTSDIPIKPSPEGAFLVADELGVLYEECAFVGDSAEDLKTALNAGMIPVNVSWGYRSKEFLVKMGLRSVLTVRMSFWIYCKSVFIV